MWDRSSGLNRVEVSSGGRRSTADTGVYYRYYVASIFFFKRSTPFFLLRHLPFPVGAVSRYLVTASAPCCLPSMVLRAWDVRGNK